ncbi:hypothetical protein D3227_38220 [Mesorhizobium waimense]|uniref:Uncharacterized protein n=1 Tax=Mesorhizobium waimense TaxID=1300307 RepID=A0A3A5K0A2_9HYPH|nr:hypothetical protein D3227_38220 [Mesorhizobium waimense]
MGILRPRPKPKKAYPNSDRFEEDGRRLYSAYNGTKVARPRRQYSSKRLRLVAIVLVLAVGAVLVFVMSQLPH